MECGCFVAGLGIGFAPVLLWIGWGSVVAVTALFVPLGIVCLTFGLLPTYGESEAEAAAAAAMSMISLSLENPYFSTPSGMGFACCWGWAGVANAGNLPSSKTLTMAFWVVVGMGAVAGCLVGRPV